MGILAQKEKNKQNSLPPITIFKNKYPYPPTFDLTFPVIFQLLHLWYSHVHFNQAIFTHTSFFEIKLVAGVFHS